MYKYTHGSEKNMNCILNKLSSCFLENSGNKLATSSGDSTVKLWDLAKNECILTFEGHSHAVWSCTWHSGGDFVASASLDMTSKVWDVNR